MAEKPYDANETIIALSDVLSEDIQETALAALTNVVIGTPVGDPKLWQGGVRSAPPGYVGGHARRNWNVSLQTPVDVVFGIEGQGGGKAAATAASVNRGTPTIEEAEMGRTNRIIIQNNVPYIGRLNSGHSEQAPVNFVEKAVQAAQQAGNNGRELVP